MATLARREGLRPLSVDAVAAAIEQLSRMAADQDRLSTDMGRLIDLLREADHIAGDAGRATVTGADVASAIAAKRRRSGRIPEAMREQLTRHVVRVETAGTVVGQVNALSVVQLGDTAFGQPSRVTATVRIGRGEVVDIEREVELGGPLHSQGRAHPGRLPGRPIRRTDHPGAPLALTASLVFEQSYGGVDGDSASLAELCALLSAVGDLPFRQDLALTGSVDQRGQVQAIGGVNEKIEGFFEPVRRAASRAPRACSSRSERARPDARQRVIAAVRARRFRVWPVETVDEAMELLTGRAAGARDADGLYPVRSVNGHVEIGLVRLAAAARAPDVARSSWPRRAAAEAASADAGRRAGGRSGPPVSPPGSCGAGGGSHRPSAAERASIERGSTASRAPRRAACPAPRPRRGGEARPCHRTRQGLQSGGRGQAHARQPATVHRGRVAGGPDQTSLASGRPGRRSRRPGSRPAPRAAAPTSRQSSGPWMRSTRWLAEGRRRAARPRPPPWPRRPAARATRGR